MQLNLTFEKHADLGDVRPAAVVALPTLAEQIVDLFRTLSGLRETRTREKAARHFRVTERRVRKRRTSRPELPQSDCEGINIGLQRRVFLEENHLVAKEAKGNAHGEHFRADPSQWNLLAVVPLTILDVELGEGFGTVRQFDRIIRVEETIPRPHVVVNEIPRRQILQGVRKLIGEVNIPSAIVVEVLPAKIILDRSQFGILLDETQTFQLHGAETGEMNVLQTRDQIQLGQKRLPRSDDDEEEFLVLENRYREASMNFTLIILISTDWVREYVPEKISPQVD